MFFVTSALIPLTLETQVTIQTFSGSAAHPDPPYRQFSTTQWILEYFVTYAFLTCDDHTRSPVSAAGDTEICPAPAQLPSTYETAERDCYRETGGETLPF